MTETRALVLIDVVDSMKLAEQLGDARIAELWAAHDRVARDLLEAHHGREIDKSDGFLLLFDAAPEAIAYAKAYHAAIAPLGLQARAGVHFGAVTLRENDPADVARGAKPLEVDGLAKSVAARVMSIARGGQTLTTAAAAPREALSHGFWMLQGILDPVELFEVSGDGRPPPDRPKAWRVHLLDGVWVPVRDVRRSLPAERDDFVGREVDLHDLASLVEDGRLVTVLGPGGTGKTRLVTRFAWTWLGEWPGGAWFCDLADAKSVDGIVSAVARALDVPLGKGDPLIQLGHAIAGRGPCLVVLDNFEQVAGFAAETLGPWLDRAADARFVVTSQQVLGVPGEQVLALDPLDEAAAIDLFVARSVSAKRDFVLSEAERPVVVELVRLLDGLPLAIELAAARVRLMPPKMLLQRMSQRFRLLASSGGRVERQSTLRAALDWSWNLLTPDERAALAQLSVFEGGFTLESGEAVLLLAEAWPVDVVQAILDKSLIRRVGEERYRLLVSVQEYAAERLAEGDDPAELRHGAFFAALGPRGAEAGGIERDNLVAACRRAVGRGDVDTAVGALEGAWEAFALRGPFAACAELATAVEALPLAKEQRSRVLRVVALAAASTGQNPRARTVLDEALATAGDRRRALDLLLELGKLAVTLADHEGGRVHLEAALAECRALGDRRGEAIALGNLGRIHVMQGRFDAGRAALEPALEIHRARGERRDEGHMLGFLAYVHQGQGRVEEARACFTGALEAYVACGDQAGQGQVSGNLGVLHAMQGRLQEARTSLERSLAVARDLGDRHSEGAACSNLGLLSVEQGHLDDARTFYLAAIAVHRETGARRSQGIVLGNLGALDLLQDRIPEAREHLEAAIAIHEEVNNPAGRGILLINLATLEMDQGNRATARKHYESSIASARQIGDVRARAIATGALGLLSGREGRFEEARACFDEGEALLRPMSSYVQIAKLLVHRAEVEHLAGQREEGLRVLAQAAELAVQVGAGDDSALGIDLNKVRAMLELSAR